MPPRHGKSELISKHLPAWFLGTYPDRQVMLGSYEGDFAAQWGRRARTLLERSGWMFDVKVAGDSSAAHRWNIEGRDGGMQTAGVGGPFTGKGANLLIIDDAIKGQEQASSERWREKTWEWWLQDVYTRLEPNGAAIVVATRWHQDDIIGRILAEMEQGGERWEYVRLPAIAEADDAIGRIPGEALWPDRFSRADLDRIQLTIGTHRFSALYQQRPTPREGGMFKLEWFEQIDPALVPTKFDTVIRAWDFGATDNDGDPSAGVLMAEKAGTLYILHVACGQWGSGDRDSRMDLLAMDDELTYGKAVKTWFPQDPGAAGKQVAEIRARDMTQAGHRVGYEPVTGSKEDRADALASRCWADWKRGQKVQVVKAHWTRAFLEELTSFPNGQHDDQVDAASMAYNKLAKPKKRIMVA